LALARAGAAGVALAALPAPAAAHALGQTFQLPVPLWLYLAGAAIAVATSFVVTAVVARGAPNEPDYPVRPVPAGPARAASVTLSVVGLAWWYGAIVAGFTVGSASLLPAVLFWIGIWVALPIITITLGNPWPSLSPFRSTFTVAEWLARRAGLADLDVGLTYPPGLGRWPAVALLGVAAWAELILSGGDTPATVATLLTGYTLLTLVGMTLFGRVAWLRNAELFEVYLGWFGRVGPLGRRSVRRELCGECAEGCDPDRCVDCPECAAAAESGERRAELRPWFTGLTEVRRAGWSDAALIVLALAIVSYDGLRETAAWAVPLRLLVDMAISIFGPTGTAFFVVDTSGLVLVAIAFGLAFVAGVTLARALGGPGAPPLTGAIGTYAATLLPIAGGYLLAHYLTLVIQGALWLPRLLGDLQLADPTTLVAPTLDWIPISAVWYLSVGAIVVGHVVAIVLAHRIALRDAPGRVVVAGLPLVAIMVGYTVLSLWIIAQPIVIDPGVPPAALPGP
jgi:hypothetical protein